MLHLSFTEYNVTHRHLVFTFNFQAQNRQSVWEYSSLTFGHVFVQFMIVWHLYTDHLSRSFSSLSSLYSSRESITHLQGSFTVSRVKYSNR